MYAHPTIVSTMAYVAADRHGTTEIVIFLYVPVLHILGETDVRVSNYHVIVIIVLLIVKYLPTMSVL